MGAIAQLHEKHTHTHRAPNNFVVTFDRHRNKQQWIFGIYWSFQCFLSIAIGDILLSKRTDYKVRDQAPDTSSRIAVVPYITTLAACLIECSRVEICTAVVRGVKTCSVNISCLELPGRESQLALNVVDIYVAKQQYA